MRENDVVKLIDDLTQKCQRFAKATSQLEDALSVSDQFWEDIGKFRDPKEVLEELIEWNKQEKASPKLIGVLNDFLRSIENIHLNTWEQDFDNTSLKNLSRTDYEGMMYAQSKGVSDAILKRDEVIPTFKTTEQLRVMESLLRSSKILDDFKSSATDKQPESVEETWLASFKKDANAASVHSSEPIQQQRIDHLVEQAEDTWDRREGAKDERNGIINKYMKWKKENTKIAASLETIETDLNELKKNLPKSFNPCYPDEYSRRHEGGKQGWDSDIPDGCVVSSVGMLLQDWGYAVQNEDAIEKIKAELKYGSRVDGKPTLGGVSHEDIPKAFSILTDDKLIATRRELYTFQQIQKEEKAMIAHMRQGEEYINHILVIDGAFERQNQRYLILRDPYSPPVEAREVPYEFARLLLTGQYYTVSKRDKGKGEAS